ncbi:SCO family protein [Lysobacter oculi]|uniref:SCO family protein n=1 Tax=Solilutibacter oculi TaxID=2698682 RepID=A0A344J7F3_9GAMM|nr:SCO family protein [Lysobacter oculi]AXA84963.1 SCO family protein [Lysobacter oculi]
MKRPLSLIAITLAMLLPLAAAQARGPAPASAPLPADSIYQLDARMTDQSGKATSLAGRRGRVQLVSMFYTSCRYICPLIIDSGLAIEKQLTPAEKARLGITLISMDPKRDDPAALTRVATRRKLDLTRWALLRPQAGDVRAIAGVLGIRYRELADGEFNHSSVMVLLDAQGRELARTEKLGSVPDPVFAAAVKKALAAR